jgi:hypothetical protein
MARKSTKVEEVELIEQEPAIEPTEEKKTETKTTSFDREKFWKFGPDERWPIHWPDIVVVTGETSSGKTTLAAGTGVPDENMAYFDFEKSARLIESQHPFGEYHDVQAELAQVHGDKAYKYTDLYSHTVKLFEDIPAGKYDAIILDNASPLEAGVAAFVENNPGLFGMTAPQMASAGGVKWGIIKDHYSQLLTRLASKTNMVIIVVQLRTQWDGKSPAKTRTGKNKYEPKGLDTLDQLSSLSLWLKQRPGMIPAGVVTKCRIGTRVWIDDPSNPPTVTIGENEIEIPKYLLNALYGESGYITIPHLPPQLPIATWPAIRHYMKNPANYSNLKEDEIAPMDEIVTEDDRIYMQFMTEQARSQTAADNLALAQIRAAASAPSQGVQPRPSTNPKPTVKAFPRTSKGLMELALHLGYEKEAYPEILKNNVKDLKAFDAARWGDMIAALFEHAPKKEVVATVQGGPEYLSKSGNGTKEDPVYENVQ